MLKLEVSTSVGLYRQIIADEDSILDSVPRLRPADLISRLEVQESHDCLTLVTTGCTVSPPMAAVCIRAGWSMGPVKDRYIHYEKAGDEFVGRTVTGITALDCNFAISPVYWNWCGLSPSEESNAKKRLEEIINGITNKNTFSAARMV